MVQKRTIRSVIHTNAGWWYAALAVLQIGFPECGVTSDTGVATEHVCTIAEFVSEMMCWLANFAAAILQRRDTRVYQEQLRRSGSSKRTSGLTEEDRKKARIRDTRWKLMYGKKLAREAHRATWASRQYRSTHRATRASWPYRSRDWIDGWEQHIFDEYTNGALSDRLQTMLSATRTTRGAQSLMFRL